MASARAEIIVGGETQDRQGVAAIAGRARWLADSSEIGWLTSDASSDGCPVEMSTLGRGTPVFAVPAHSAHRSAGGSAATLLVTEPAMGGLAPADAARLTLLGSARVLSDETAAIGSFRRRASEVHDGEVTVYGLDVVSARYKPRVGSWLREVTLTAAAWLAAAPGRPPADLAALVSHLNDEHAEVLEELVAGSGTPAGGATVLIAGVRPHRLELTAMTADGVTATCLAFRRPVGTPADLAAELLRRLGRVGWGHCTRTLQRCPERHLPP